MPTASDPLPAGADCSLVQGNTPSFIPIKTGTKYGVSHAFAA